MISLKTRLEAGSVRNEETGCIEWQKARNYSGYGTLWFNGRAGGAHRAAWLVANGGIPSGMQVLHRCDNRLCINPDHLFLGTNADNVADKVAKGRQYRPYAKGQANGHSKLTDAEAALIREMANKGVANRPLAEKFGVSTMTISMIRNNKTWTHVGGVEA